MSLSSWCWNIGILLERWKGHPNSQMCIPKMVVQDGDESHTKIHKKLPTKTTPSTSQFLDVTISIHWKVQPGFFDYFFFELSGSSAMVSKNQQCTKGTFVWPVVNFLEFFLFNFASQVKEVNKKKHIYGKHIWPTNQRKIIWSPGYLWFQ